MIPSSVKTVIGKGLALMERILAEKPDPTAIRQAFADLGSSIGDGAVEASSLAEQAQAILTPHQRERFQEIRRNRQRILGETVREWREQGPDS